MIIPPSDKSYRKFCEITAGYRVFQLVRHAVRLGVIEAVGGEGNSSATILEATGMKRSEGGRFLALLCAAGLLERYGDRFFLSQFSRAFLHQESQWSQTNVVAFEEILMERWGRLDAILLQGQGSQQETLPDCDYRNRLRLFHAAMHEAAVVRARELWEALSFLPGSGTIVDIGSGDGTYLKTFLEGNPGWQGVACDLADVLDLAGNPCDQAITSWPINVLDADDAARLCRDWKGKAAVLLLSNFLHCYSETEATGILSRVEGLVSDDGVVVVHDFFTDANDFGALYDGHMLANTFSGRTYGIDETKGLIAAAGFVHACEFHLPSASSAVVASRSPFTGVEVDLVPLLQRQALSVGLIDAKPVAVESIRVEPWVKAKCRYGCALYGRKWSCPPHAMDSKEFIKLLSSYRRGLLVVGQPPLRGFQERLLELEKQAFLHGLKKALAFSGGPCAWCESCPDERCAFPEKRRPSLESCGCDVFELAAKCGVDLRPVKQKDDFIQYVGLLLVE